MSTIQLKARAPRPDATPMRMPISVPLQMRFMRRGAKGPEILTTMEHYNTGVSGAQALTENEGGVSLSFWKPVLRLIQMNQPRSV